MNLCSCRIETCELAHPNGDNEAELIWRRWRIQDNSIK